MSSTAHALPTFDDLYREIEALPQGITGEILGPGWLRTMSRPGGRHSFGAQRILRALRSFNLVDDGTGWWLEWEREIRFPDDRLFVPDVCGWRVEAPPAFVDDNPIAVVPEWACEILSRSTQRGDRTFKLPYYARNGTAHIWVVDPEARTVEVYAAHDGLPVLVATASGDERKALPPFDADIAVGDLWKPTAA